MRGRTRWPLTALLILGLVAIASQRLLQPRSTLERIQDTGVLRVVTSSGPATIHATPEGPDGLEYALASALAEHLGVKLELLVAYSEQGVYHALRTGAADIAAAGLDVGQSGLDGVYYTAPFLEVEQHLVGRQGGPDPGDPEQSGNRTVQVIDSHGFRQQVEHAADRLQHLQWVVVDDETLEGLLRKVWAREVDWAIADDLNFRAVRHAYPELEVALTFDEPRRLGWAMVGTGDRSLIDPVEALLAQLTADGTLEALREQHFGHLERFDYVDARVFLRRVDERLPRFVRDFRRYGTRNGVDWTLLAAMGYQESHWDPDAVSATGVRGLMMLTEVTAAHLGVADRTDARQSIDGGARYLADLHRRLPKRIPEPDRTWFALAAYNIGMGHLEDARRLTQSLGLDPDLWIDVRRTLPKLEDEAWHSRTRYGYARGSEAVQFVHRVRTYHDMLGRVVRAATNAPDLAMVAIRYEPIDRHAHPMSRMLHQLL